MLTLQQMEGYLGKPITAICNNGFVASADNHCAHFVSHVLGYEFGATCKMMGTGKNPGANLRVQEIFPRCATVGTWASLPSPLAECLAFITRASNVNLKTKVMTNVPRKHIGIYFSGLIWHYSNSHHQVVRQTPDEFSHHYAAPDNARFFGTLL